MTRLVKKNKQEEVFDSSKIYKAIISAMKSGSGLLRPKIAQVITEEAEEKFTKKENVSFLITPFVEFLCDSRI